jgi:hypothetical protein
VRLTLTNGRVEMNKFPFLIIFVAVLITIRLAHCDDAWARVMHMMEYHSATMDDTLLKYNHILDSLKAKIEDRELLRLDLIELEYKNLEIDSLKKELSK